MNSESCGASEQCYSCSQSSPVYAINSSIIHDATFFLSGRIASVCNRNQLVHIAVDQCYVSSMPEI